MCGFPFSFSYHVNRGWEADGRPLTTTQMVNSSLAPCHSTSQRLRHSPPRSPLLGMFSHTI